LAEVGDEVDGHGDQDRAEQIGQEGVWQCLPTGIAAVRFNVGDGVGHPDGEREVGEVAVRGWTLLVEVESPLSVVDELLENVLEGVHRVHERPGHHRAENAEDDQRDGCCVTGLVSGLDQSDDDSADARETARDDGVVGDAG